MANKEDILYQLHPDIRKFITYIWKQNERHASSGKITILKPSSSMNQCEGGKGYANKFAVIILYAGQHIEWEVKFFYDQITFAPDFYVGNGSFATELTAKLVNEKISSWYNWNFKDPSSLYNVLMEFLQLFKNHELKKLEAVRYSRLHFEFGALTGGTSITVDEVEVLVDSAGVVHFLIALKIEFSQLVQNVIKDPKLEPSVSLMITFPCPDGTNAQSHIFITPPIDQSVLNAENRQVPPFPSNGCLMDYVPAVEKLLQDRIQFIVDNYALKHAYIAYFTSKYTTNVLEYDNIKYSKVNLLFDIYGFHWLLVIALSNNFPKEKPTWILRSIYHISFDEPITEVLQDYPYSPRWSSEEMIQRALKYLTEKVHQLQIKKKRPPFAMVNKRMNEY